MPEPCISGNPDDGSSRRFQESEPPEEAGKARLATAGSTRLLIRTWWRCVAVQHVSNPVVGKPEHGSVSLIRLEVFAVCCFSGSVVHACSIRNAFLIFTTNEILWRYHGRHSCASEVRGLLETLAYPDRLEACPLLLGTIRCQMLICRVSVCPSV